MSSKPRWRHNHSHICELQNAHADCIEAIYRDDALIDSEGVDIKQIGGVRTFYSSKAGGFNNRAIFTGNEAPELIDEVLQHFVDKKSACWIEINPANFYSSDPSTIGSKILSHLIQRECIIRNFRTVWVRDTPLGPEEQDFSLDCRQVENNLVYAQSMIEGGESSGDNMPELETSPGWFFYVGFHQDRPVSWTKLYCKGESAHLMGADTHDDFLCRGYHGQLIRLRIRDAFEMGAKRVYTQTTFNNQSSMNLERAGFQLAYNCLMLFREPIPVD